MVPLWNCHFGHSPRRCVLSPLKYYQAHWERVLVVVLGGERDKMPQRASHPPPICRFDYALLNFSIS